MSPTLKRVLKADVRRQASLHGFQFLMILIRPIKASLPRDPRPSSCELRPHYRRCQSVPRSNWPKPMLASSTPHYRIADRTGEIEKIPHRSRLMRGDVLRCRACFPPQSGQSAHGPKSDLGQGRPTCAHPGQSGPCNWHPKVDSIHGTARCRGSTHCGRANLY